MDGQNGTFDTGRILLAIFFFSPRAFALLSSPSFSLCWFLASLALGYLVPGVWRWTHENQPLVACFSFFACCSRVDVCKKEIGGFGCSDEFVEDEHGRTGCALSFTCLAEFV